MWRQVRETGREGLQERQEAAEEEGHGRGHRFWREKWRGREGEERETHGRDGGVGERDKERRRKADTGEETEMGERWRVT